METKQGSKSTIKKIGALVSMRQINDVLKSDLTNQEALLRISQIVTEYYNDQV